jgi:two-component system phosphate regulon sensor histidine kinase PhoR
MLTPISIALLLNGLTLSLSLGLLLLILWYDPRRVTNLYFAWFLFMVIIWSAGSLLGRGAAVAGAEARYIELGLRLLEIGFTGSSLALYLYAIILIGNRSRQFQVIAISAVVMLSAYHLAFLALSTIPEYQVGETGLLYYRFPSANVVFFSLLNLATLAVVWQGFRKIQRPALAFGMMLFCFGQLAALLSPRLQILAVAEDAAGLATFVMSFALVQAQIIQPLVGQARQSEVVRDVGLAITSRLRLQNVLETFAAQAVALLRAEASLMFLRREEEGALVLAAQYNIHKNLLGHRLRLDEGLAGKVAQERRPLLLADYRRDWKGQPDAPFAEQGFGSVIAVPLMFAEEVVGVLLVIQSVEGRLFEPEDVRVLELLAPQAAVAITNSRLFEQERALRDKLDTAKTQLEAILSSTDNPVLALNKGLRIIFANAAAAALVKQAPQEIEDQALLELVPPSYLPKQLRELLTTLTKQKSYIYELTVADRTYLCHIARIELPHRGWVVVMNDVTSLKELDRLQRQMVELTTHQLKNPLQGAFAHLDELYDLGEELMDEDMLYAMRVIEEQLNRMRNIIDGILNLERLHSRSKARNEAVDLNQISRDVAETLQQYADSKGIQLDLALDEGRPKIVMGDPKELTEVISNLVDNAIKYSRPEGFVRVEVEQTPHEALVKVIDDGVGIPLESQRHVFERFFRAEQPGTEGVGGTGIGLSLVKAIVETHKGRVWFESEFQKGTRFFISLPLATSPEAKPEVA